MVSPRRALVPVLLATLGSTACGGTPGANPGTDAAVRTDASGTDGGTGVACVPGPTVDLAGTWAIRVRLGVSLTQHPGGLVRLCPDPQSTSASLLIRMGIRGTGTHVTQTVQVCQVALPQARGGVGGCPTQPLSIRLAPSAALAGYIPRFVIPDIQSDLPSTAVCSPYAPDAFTVTLGLRAGALTHPDTDPLPSWCAPCAGATAAQCICRDCAQTGAACVARDGDVEDSDGDGNPGVSVAVSTGASPDPIMGEAWLAFRTRPHLRGIIRDANRIDGPMDATLDYAVVGSGVQVVGTRLDPAALTGALPDFQIVPDGSDFVMLRADGAELPQWDADGNGTVDCTDIVARTNNFDR